MIRTLIDSIGIMLIVWLVFRELEHQFYIGEQKAMKLLLSATEMELEMARAKLEEAGGIRRMR